MHCVARTLQVRTSAAAKNHRRRRDVDCFGYVLPVFLHPSEQRKPSRSTPCPAAYGLLIRLMSAPFTVQLSAGWRWGRRRGVRTTMGRATSSPSASRAAAGGTHATPAMTPAPTTTPRSGRTRRGAPRPCSVGCVATASQSAPISTGRATACTPAHRATPLSTLVARGITAGTLRLDPRSSAQRRPERRPQPRNGNRSARLATNAPAHLHCSLPYPRRVDVKALPAPRAAPARHRCGPRAAKSMRTRYPPHPAQLA